MRLRGRLTRLNFFPSRTRLPLTEPRSASRYAPRRFYGRTGPLGPPARAAVGTCLLSFRPGSQCTECLGGDPWHHGSPTHTSRPRRVL